MSRGYFGLAILNFKKEANVGTLFRTAHSFNANFLMTIGRKYKIEAADTTKSIYHVPYFHFDDFDLFKKHLPADTKLIAVELDNNASSVINFVHPERCVYLLGNEAYGIHKKYLNQCDYIVQIPGQFCLNVGVAGSILLYDRISKNYSRYRQQEVHR